MMTHQVLFDLAYLDRFIPAFRGSTPAPLLVPRVSPHSSLVGTAFDYAVRVELKHRAPHARSDHWIAESALPLLSRRDRANAERTIGAARQAFEHLPKNVLARFSIIADHAARLAPLDLMYRAGLSPFDGTSQVDDKSIAAEVAALLAVASPLWSFATEGTLLLNPAVCGNLVGGADADIIVGNTIIELKTSKDPIVERDHLRQLVGYACLAALAPENVFPRIDTLAVYLPRFGLLRTFPLVAAREDLIDTAAFLSDTWRGCGAPAASRQRVAS